MGKEGTKEKLDIELEAPADFTSPEVLYQDLVKTIHKYHPSGFRRSAPGSGQHPQYVKGCRL